MNAKILTLDIETSPNLGYFFGVWQQNMTPDKIIQPTYMLSWAAKWLGEPASATVYRDFRHPDFLNELFLMLVQADAVITYNGDKFDLRHINREFAQEGYCRPRPVAQIDMFKVVKQMFNFPHNSLDYVCSVLLDEKKLETGGFSLWPDFMEGDPKAVKTMTRYNKRDVILTEKLYKLLRGWIPNHPYVGSIPEDHIHDEDVTYECPACASTKTSKLRPRRTRCFAIRVVQCTNCGNISDGKRAKI